MGRNDSVQSITGVSNVFVDYPEYAWLLFGQEVPEMVTPSGKAAQQNCQHARTQLQDAVDATCVLDGYTGDTYCLDCGTLVTAGNAIAATGKHVLGKDGHCTTCDFVYCKHANTELRNKKDATCVDIGYSGDTFCLDCQTEIATGNATPATGKHDLDEIGHCINCPHTDEHESTDISPALWVLIGIGVAAVAVVVVVVIKKKC